MIAISKKGNFVSFLSQKYANTETPIFILQNKLSLRKGWWINYTVELC